MLQQTQCRKRLMQLNVLVSHLYCDYHILLRFLQRYIIIRETFANLPAVPSKLVASLSFVVP